MGVLDLLLDFFEGGGAVEGDVQMMATNEARSFIPIGAVAVDVEVVECIGLASRIGAVRFFELY